MKKAMSGFTIVELLIVIVVIAILAAISIVTYAGMQQRAKNTAIISAASSSYRALQAYIAANGAYPFTNASACITTTIGCTSDSGATVSSNSGFNTALSSIAQLPQSVPVASAARWGIYAQNTTTVMVEGSSQPMLLIYYLSGTSQPCGLDRILEYNWPNINFSATKYTYNIAGTTTMCWVSIPGPSV